MLSDTIHAGTAMLWLALLGGCGGNSGVDPGVVTIDGPAERLVRNSAGGTSLSGTVWVPAGSTCNRAAGVASLGTYRFRWRNEARGVVHDIALTWDCLAFADSIPWQADVQLAIGSNKVIVEMDDDERHGEANVQITWDPIVKPFPPRTSSPGAAQPAGG